MDNITEMEALKQIKDGRKLSEFDEITGLMKIAAATYQDDPYLEFTEDMWTRRLARMAVKKDFRYIDKIPERMRPFCVPEFAQAGRSLTQKNIKDFAAVFDRQPEQFKKNAIRHNPSLSRFIPEKEKRQQQMIRHDSPRLNADPFYPVIEEAGFDFTSAGMSRQDELDPETFLSLPVEEQTLPLLEMMINSDDIELPGDFIKRLQTPNRNEAYYRKHDDAKAADLWASRIIPYLDRKLCFKIAMLHPEGAVKTSAYLTPEGVRRYWEKKKAADTPRKVMTEIFLMFPEDTLYSDMKEDMDITWQVLKHAPSIFLESDDAAKYLARHPGDILRLPACYQNVKSILADGVNITKGTLSGIKDPDLRERVAMAFGIR